MKKFFILLFLMAIGTTVNAQWLETSSSTNLGYIRTNGYYMNSTNSSYYTEDGVLYAGWNETYQNVDHKYDFLVKYPASKQNTSFTVPAGTERICRGAFQGNKFLQTIRIPSTLEYIGDNAFDGCESLRSIEVYEVSSSIQAVEMDDNTEKKEIGRYNINGVKVEEKDGGIQIILYSDGSADKVLEQP